MDISPSSNNKHQAVTGQNTEHEDSRNHKLTNKIEDTQSWRDSDKIEKFHKKSTFKNLNSKARPKYQDDDLNSQFVSFNQGIQGHKKVATTIKQDCNPDSDESSEEDKISERIRKRKLQAQISQDRRHSYTAQKMLGLQGKKIDATKLKLESINNKEKKKKKHENEDKNSKGFDDSICFQNNLTNQIQRSSSYNIQSILIKSSPQEIKRVDVLNTKISKEKINNENKAQKNPSENKFKSIPSFAVGQIDKKMNTVAGISIAKIIRQKLQKLKKKSYT